VVLSDRPGSNLAQLRKQEILFKCKKDLAVRVVEHRNRLPREIMEVFKSHLDVVHEHPALAQAALSSGIGLGDLQRCLQASKIL